MPRLMVTVRVVVFGLFALSMAVPVEAAVTAAQQRELVLVGREVQQAGVLIRQKKIEQAEMLLNQAEQRLNKIVQDAGLSDKVPLIASFKKQIAVQRAVIAKLKTPPPSGKAGGVSFTKDVAPILSDRCLGCHAGDDAKGKLRLDTFAGMKQGGEHGPLLVIGKPSRSLIIHRLNAPAAQRMPKDDKPLTKEQIRTIALWIDQGAKFDGKDELDPISEGTKPKDAGPVPIPRPKGNETVSFSKDIAPFMANICLRCHGGKNPRSEFSVETFEKLMTGGKSGRVIVPGDLKESRLWHLVGEQKPFKMPPGNVEITRTNWRNLQTWIEEGAAYDGGDPKKRLREIAPSEAQKRAAELAKMSPEEFVEFRKKRSRELWDRTLPKDTPQIVETDEFLVMGNVPEERLQEIGRWAEEQAESLRKLFGTKEARLWKGKLAVFVFKDRFGYEEFNFTIHDRSTPREMIGHSVVSSTFEDAYVALEDIGDEVSAASGGMRVNLIDHVTGAFLQRSGVDIPDWLMRGTGLALAARADPKNVYVNSLRRTAPELLQTLKQPEDVFANGTFSPSGVAAVGYTLVEFLLKEEGGAKFGRLIRSLQNGQDLSAAMRGAYGGTPKQIAQAYVLHLRAKSG